MIGMAAGLPVQQRATDDANGADTSPRFRRRAGNLNVTTLPLEYILDLYEAGYENGVPTGKATDIWVFADKGEVAIPTRTHLKFHLSRLVIII